MAHKKKRKTFSEWLKRMLLKYGCIALFLPGLLITPSEYVPAVLFGLALLCYVWVVIFNWREDIKSDSRTKRIKLLAHFWRYGYTILLIPSLPLIRHRKFLFTAVALYGAYTIVIACAMCKHFVCGMQDASHQPMDPWKRRIPTDSYRRDGLLMGIFFLILGIIGLIVA